MVVFSLTLVRHGETDANKDGVIQGHQDVGLSETGVTQARLVAFRLRNDTFTHIFTSDLLRAARTAQIIAETNTARRCSVIPDPCLRERKFGVFEGKTFKELFAAAQERKQKWSDFTPEGGETYQQVRFRAKTFFRELCHKMVTSSAERTYIPPSSHDSRNSSEDPQNRLTSEISEKTASGEETKAITSLPDIIQQSGEETVAAKRPRVSEPQLHRLSLDGVGPSPDADCAFGSPQDAGATTMARSNSSSSSGCSSLHDSVECPDVDLPTPAEEETDCSNTGVSRGERRPASCPEPPGGKSGSGPEVGSGSGSGLEGGNQGRRWCSLAGQSAVTWLWEGLQPWVKDVDPTSGSPVDYGELCPNVSLSPLAEHRLASLSSVSSGRNSSFDDADFVPAVVGEVLVVSHGGFIKELVSHFVEDLHCKVPGGKGHALRVCPNTGVSRFMVTLDHPEQRPAVTCLLINDKEHLKSCQQTPVPVPLPPHQA